MSLNIPIPSELGDYSWLETLMEGNEVNQTIPLYIESDNDIEVLAVSLLCGDRLRILYRAQSGWRALTEYELQEEPIVHVDDLLNAVVSFTGPDAKVVRKLAQKLGETLEDQWMMSFVPYSQSGKGERFKELRSECDCLTLDDPSVRQVSGMSEIENTTEYRCQNCMQLYGIEHQGQQIKLDRIFDTEWLFTDSDIDSIIEIGDDNSFLVYSDGCPISKPERVLEAMASSGGDTSSSFARYIPENHQGLIYLQEEESVGYLTWEELDGIQVLRQLYVRGPYRRMGIAEELILSWCREYCENGVYYIDEPNEKSRPLFSKIGHLEGKGEYEAIELYPIRGVGNSLDAS